MTSGVRTIRKLLAICRSVAWSDAVTTSNFNFASPLYGFVIQADSSGPSRERGPRKHTWSKLTPCLSKPDSTCSSASGQFALRRASCCSQAPRSGEPPIESLSKKRQAATNRLPSRPACFLSLTGPALPFQPIANREPSYAPTRLFGLQEL